MRRPPGAWTVDQSRPDLNDSSGVCRKAADAVGRTVSNPLRERDATHVTASAWCQICGTPPPRAQ
jgi:hypothetical protein